MFKWRILHIILLDSIEFLGKVLKMATAFYVLYLPQSQKNIVFTF